MLKIKQFIAISEDRDTTVIIERVCDEIMLTLSDRGGHKVVFLSRGVANEITEAINQLNAGKPVL